MQPPPQPDANIIVVSFFTLGFMRGFFRPIAMHPNPPPLAKSIGLGFTLAFTFALFSYPAFQSYPYQWYVALPYYLYFAWHLPAIARGMFIFYHYYLTRHPAVPIIEPALRADQPIDYKAAKPFLTPDPAAMNNPPPAYVSKVQQERAEALKDAMLADADVAEAIIKRERARAKLKNWFRLSKENDQ